MIKTHLLLISVLIIIFFVGNIFAQTSQNECNNYGKKDFIGKQMSHNFIKSDIRGFLDYLTDIFGCHFVLDKQVERNDLMINVSDVPWNIVLDLILKKLDLGIQIHGKLFRIADLKTLESEQKLIISDILEDDKPFITESIKLKYLPNKEIEMGKEKLLESFKRRLSSRGSIEFDEDSNILKITDVNANMFAIKELIKLIDVKVNMKEYLEQKQKQKDAMKNYRGCIPSVISNKPNN